jgi:hypothetical protein
MTGQFLSTQDAASRLGCSYFRLYALLRRGLVESPPRIGGRLMWTPEAIAGAARALARRRPAAAR